MTIPASVTGIESRAFLGCSGLKQAIFMGNAPGMGSDVFGSSASGFTVYYPSGAVGFSTPTWLGTYTAFPISARLVLTRLTGANANKVLAQVFLDNVPAGQAGISFRVDYPPSVLRIVGASSLTIPAGDLPSGNTAQWNVFPGNDYANQTGSVSLAAAWGSAWTFTAGQSVANLVFELQPTITGQVHFALTLAETETGPYRSRQGGASSGAS